MNSIGRLATPTCQGCRGASSSVSPQPHRSPSDQAPIGELKMVLRPRFWDNRLCVVTAGLIAGSDATKGVLIAITIELSPDARDHLGRFRKRDQRVVIIEPSIQCPDRAVAAILS